MVTTNNIIDRDRRKDSKSSSLPLATSMYFHAKSNAKEGKQKCAKEGKQKCAAGSSTAACINRSWAIRAVTGLCVIKRYPNTGLLSGASTSIDWDMDVPAKIEY